MAGLRITIKVGLAPFLNQGILVRHATFSMYRFLVDKGGLDRDAPFRVRGWSFIFLLENELLAKHREGVSLTHSYCFFDSSIPIYELGIQFGILRTNSCCQRGSQPLLVVFPANCIKYTKWNAFESRMQERSFPESIDSSQVVEKDLVFVLSPTLGFSFSR